MQTVAPYRTRFAPVLALVALALLAAGACRSTEPSESTQDTVLATSVAGGTLVMAVDQETDGWNPLISQWTNAGYWPGSAMIEPLATHDEQGETVMWLAESITPTVEGALDSWLITVKPGITLHNGEVLDADLLKANLDQLTNGKALVGVAIGPRFVGFTPVGERTVRADLDGPWADFPALMAGPTGMIMAKEMLDAPLGGLDRPIGTGPFVFDSWVPNESLKVHRNPDYWRPGEPLLDSIEFRPMVDNKQAVEALRRGDVDMIATTKAEDVAAVGDGNVVRKDFTSEKTFMQLNVAQHPEVGPNPLGNVHARRALAYGTDRAAIRAMVGAGQDLVTTTQPMVPGTPWAIPEEETGYYPHDPAAARQELAKYTAETGKATLTFELSTTLAPDDLAIAQALADQWRTLGVDAQVRGKDTQAMVFDTVMGRYHAVVQRNYAYPNPDLLLPMFISTNAKGPGKLSINFSQYPDRVIDEAAVAIQNTTDRATQRASYRTITRRLNEAALLQWLYDTPFAVIHSPAITGTEVLETRSFATALPKPWFWGHVGRI